MSADLFADTLQIGAAVAASYAMLMIGRGIAARIAGPANAHLVLGMALVSFSFASPLPRLRGETDQELSAETENTTTAENSQEQDGSGLVSLAANGSRWDTIRMTGEEKAELDACYHEAVGLLTMCVRYYERLNETDNGVIPHYKKLAMNADNRGKITANLEYSGFVSIINRGKTFIVPEIGSCAAALELIKSKSKRVYPFGYAERKQAALDAAVMGLPEVNA